MEQDLRLIHDDRNVVSMCKLKEGGPRDTIILYLESGHAPLAVEVPKGVVGGIDGGLVKGLVEGLLEGVMLVWGKKRSLIG